MDDHTVLRLSPPPAEVEVVLRDVRRPYGDDVTTFAVDLTGDGIGATAEVTTLSGDLGRRTQDDGSDLVSLADVLDQLARAATPWIGRLGWRSLADELRMELSCNPRGEVTVAVTVKGSAVEPAWTVLTAFHLPLGELAGLGAAIAAWVEHPDD